MPDDQTLLATVFSQVAENLAFMFIDTPEDEDFDLGVTKFVRASMRFHGPFAGRLAIAVPEAMCPEIAANVLGLDPGDELVTNQPYDALKELLNVTCGNLLTAVAGDDPVFDLTVPEVEPLNRDAWDAFKEEAGVVSFVVEDKPVLLRFDRED
jgi:chemotaxis protein CheY-P-specific phosphatase CheC